MTNFDRLLNPNSIPPDLSAARPIIEGATVLVTGAGGSIGSEVCRLILHLHPAALLLLGRGENSIYQIHQELSETDCGRTDLLPIIADVRDRPRCAAIIVEHRPTVVIHTAAHKHVPMMEANPSEAVACNVFGTESLLDACEAAGSVQRLVLVSTDKAVNPVSIMGATKRVAELLVRIEAETHGRSYAVARLGNVLGSRGSVLPLWRRQIAAGGPVTVTHPDAMRHFITVSGAAAFILEVAAMAQPGPANTFVPEMGETVRVYDLAAELIRQSGRPTGIAFTGLRPGEKLHEELFGPNEIGVPNYDGRFWNVGAPRVDREALGTALDELRDWLEIGVYAPGPWRQELQRAVPEYRPAEKREAVGVA